MKEDKKKRLDRLLLMQKLKYGAMGLGAAAILAGLMFFIGYETEKKVDPIVSRRTVSGAVMDARRGAGRRSGYRLIVRLDDGRSVKSFTPPYMSAIPYRGERVELYEEIHKSARKSWSFARLLGEK
jgi:hypothetical protein